MQKTFLNKNNANIVIIMFSSFFFKTKQIEQVNEKRKLEKNLYVFFFFL